MPSFPCSDADISSHIKASAGEDHVLEILLHIFFGFVFFPVFMTGQLGRSNLLFI